MAGINEAFAGLRKDVLRRLDKLIEAEGHIRTACRCCEDIGYEQGVRASQAALEVVERKQSEIQSIYGALDKLESMYGKKSSDDQ